jgi:hypothetical protein
MLVNRGGDIRDGGRQEAHEADSEGAVVRVAISCRTISTFLVIGRYHVRCQASQRGILAAAI